MTVRLPPLNGVTLLLGKDECMQSWHVRSQRWASGRGASMERADESRKLKDENEVARTSPFQHIGRTLPMGKVERM